VANTFITPGTAVRIRLAAALLADPHYVEGYGRNATGGAGQSVYTVTSSAASGAGSFDAAFPLNIGGNAGVRNKIIQFAVPSFTSNQRHVVGTNVTIDGTLNGNGGVTFDHAASPGVRQGLFLYDGEPNVIIRGINFRSTGAPNSENTDPSTVCPEENFIWLAAGVLSNGGVLSTVLIDRCTFYQATNKAIDITNGNGFASITEYVTVQRCLFIDNALTSHIKYADGTSTIRRNISYHHSVFVHGGERQPQLVDAIGLFDYVNNIVYLVNPGYYQTHYPDGSVVDPYGFRAWCTSAAGQALRVGASGDTFHGDVLANLEANAFLGNAASVVILADTAIPGDGSPASTAGIYIAADNFFEGDPNLPVLYALVGDDTTGAAVSNPALPWHSRNVVAAPYGVATRLAVGQMSADLLPYVGAPNRTVLDQQRLDEVAARLAIEITLVQQASTSLGGGPTSVDLAYPSSVTAGNLLVVVGSHLQQNVEASEVADTMGNDWTLAASYNPTTADGPVHDVIWYAVANATGATTVTLTGEAITLTLFVYEYSGAGGVVNGTPVTALGATAFAPFPTIDPGDLTTTVDGALLLTLTWYSQGGGWGTPFPLTAGDGWTKRTELESGDGYGTGNRHLALQDRVGGVAGAQDMAWTSTGGVWSAIGVAFQPI
jgi:hypothetical protein